MKRKRDRIDELRETSSEGKHFSHIMTLRMCGSILLCFSDTDASKIRFVREAVRSTKRFSKVQACDKGVEEAIKWIAERTPQEVSFNAN